jgi:nitrogen regulatory protein P-II 1
MKQITAIIAPHRLHQVLAALRALPHFPGYTRLSGDGEGRGHGAGGAYVPDESMIDPHPREILLIACRDQDTDSIADAIRAASHTGLRGDGLILIADLEHVIRIRSGDRDDAAV